MGGTKRILIVRHPDDPFGKVAYVIHLLIDEWRRRNARVEITSRIDRAADAEVVVPHLDMTVTPAAYREFFARCPVVLNRDVCDISKRRISLNLVVAAGAFDGPVIVKTNRNAAGVPEMKRLRRMGRAGRMMLAAARCLPWTLTGLIGPFDYRIFDHTRQVPRAVWHNPRLVVEKFLPERHRQLYCLRQYVFLGLRELNVMSLSTEPIVKARNVKSREVVTQIPPSLRTLRKTLGFDYGKFDYVIRDGEAVLFDANRTPTYDAGSQAGSPRSLLIDLASGLDSFFGVP